MKTAILVVAPPRSGTSMTSHMISELGVDFGKPERFVQPPVRFNPIYFELQTLNDLNDRVYSHFGKHFADFDWTPKIADFDESVLASFRTQIAEMISTEFGDSSLIGMKDTRFCYTLPLWDKVLAELGYHPRYVFARRRAEGIWGSCTSVNGLPDEKNMRLVVQSLFAARNFLDGKDWISVRYEHVLRRKYWTAFRLSRWLGTKLSNIPKATSVVRPELAKFGDGDTFPAAIGDMLDNDKFDAESYASYLRHPAKYLRS